MNLTPFRLLALMLSFSLLASACSGTDPEADESASSTQTESSTSTNIRVLHLRQSAFTRQLDLTGTVEPWKTVTLSSEVMGKLENFRLTEGQNVKQGQTLASVNSRMLTAQKNQAEANYRLSQLQEKWQAQNLTKQVDLAETAYANSASNHTRQQQLYQEQVVSAQNFDNSASNLTNAKLQLELQKIGRASGQELNQQQTRVAATSLELARVSLAQATLTSPITGFVNRVLVENGEVVSPGAPLAEIVQMNRVKLTVGVPERDILAVSMGQEVDVSFDALPGQTYKGRVIFLAAVADNDSKTFPIRIQIENPDLKIRGGMIGRIAINQGQLNDAIVIPQDAVIDEKGGRVVFIEQEGQAKKVNVSLGTRRGTEVVVNQGLKAGDALIILGHRNLLDTDPVNVLERRYQGNALPPEPTVAMPSAAAQPSDVSSSAKRED